MREITCSTITDAIKKMCIEAATILPQDVEKALSQKHDEEDSALAQKTLQVLMDNAKLAQEKQMPICQDFIDILSTFLWIVSNEKSARKRFHLFWNTSRIICVPADDLLSRFLPHPSQK